MRISWEQIGDEFPRRWDSNCVRRSTPGVEWSGRIRACEKFFLVEVFHGSRPIFWEQRPTLAEAKRRGAEVMRALCGGPVHRDYCVNPHCRIAELEDQVEALTAQLEEEELMVRRWREVVLGAPQGTVKLLPATPVESFAWVVELAPDNWPEGTKVALVRLTPDGPGLAGDVDGPARTGTDGHGGRLPDIKAMAEAWVRRVRGDALVNPEAGCGCALGDLMPCDHNTCDCMPARRFFCLECEAPTYQGCLGTPVLPPQCYECRGPTVLWPEGAPVPEKVTTKNTDHTEEGVRA